MKKIYHKRLGSTNEEAKLLAQQGAAPGTVVWAACQTRGRGRLGKSWFSKEGAGLYCSLILRPTIDFAELAKATMVCGVVVGELLARCLGQQLQLKWPNDIFFAGRKCAGILLESSPFGSGQEPFLVVGIGINVNQIATDFPAEIADTATSMRLLSGRRWELEPLLDEILPELVAGLEDFFAKGFAPFLGRWKKKDFLLGRNLQALAMDGQIVSGLSLGPDEDGVLLLQSATGQIHRILSGDVSLANRS